MFTFKLSSFNYKKIAKLESLNQLRQGKNSRDPLILSSYQRQCVTAVQININLFAYYFI